MCSIKTNIIFELVGIFHTSNLHIDARWMARLYVKLPYSLARRGVRAINHWYSGVIREISASDIPKTGKVRTNVEKQRNAMFLQKLKKTVATILVRKKRT